MSELATRTPKACDADATKLALLRGALASADVATTAAAAFRPDDASADWQPGVFAYAAAVRQHLPDGLAADDFDGVNVEAALAT